MLRSSVQGDFEMVNKLAFTADNRRVLVRGKYGRWRLMAFERASGEPVATWPNLNDLGDGEFAIATTHDRLAFFSRGLAHVYELPTSGRISTCVGLKPRVSLGLANAVMLALVTELMRQLACGAKAP